MNHDWSESPGFHIGWALGQSWVWGDQCEFQKKFSAIAWEDNSDLHPSD